MNCESIFKRYWRYWKYLGLAPDRNKKYLWCGLDLLFSMSVTFWFSAHLIIGIFQSHTPEDVLSNIVVIATSVSCGIKHIILRRKLAQMQRINVSLAELDKRMQQEPDEQDYFQMMMRNAQRMANAFLYMYLGTNVIGAVKIAVNGRGELLYPAWFPFDWNGSLHAFIVAVAYQYFAQFVIILQDLSNDLFGPLSLSLIAGHVHLLGLRIRKLGYGDDVELSPKQRYAKLVTHIEDYKELMRLLKLTESTISYVYLTQFIVTGINVVIAIIYLLFFGDDIAIYLYYIMHLVCVILELFPACYYGTVLSLEFESLPYAIFSCNWMDQQLGFRRSIIIFGELSMNRIEIVAGNMMRLNLDSFVATSKMAYSIFTVLQTHSSVSPRASSKKEYQSITPELHKMNCESLSKRYWVFWKYLGIAHNSNKHLWRALDIFLSISVTFWFPVHLMIGLFHSRTLEEVLANLILNVTSAACSIKHILLRCKLAQMQHINESLAELDKHVQQEPDEQYYFKNVMLRNAERIINGFSYVYLVAIAVGLVKIGVNRRSRLSFPAWFPFDWNASLHAFLAAVCYQYLGQAMEICQNLANDIYGPLNLYLIAGHVHLLGLRIKKLGYGSDVELSPEQRYAKLVTCIEDYIELMRLFKLTESTISYVYFTQFIVTGINVVVTVVYMLFFAENMLVYIFYIMTITAITIELFPACYYGTVLSLEFERLPYAIFSCNWMDQQLCFRRSVVIFSEQSKRSIEVVAGGMMRLNLTSFIATSKMAYSVFTVLQTMK